MYSGFITCRAIVAHTEEVGISLRNKGKPLKGFKQGEKGKREVEREEEIEHARDSKPMRS